MTISFCFIVLSLAGSTAAHSMGNRQLEFGRAVSVPTKKQSHSKSAAAAPRYVRSKGKMMSKSMTMSRSYDAYTDEMEFLEVDQEIFQSMSFSMSFTDPLSPSAPSYNSPSQTPPGYSGDPSLGGPSGVGSPGSGAPGSGSPGIPSNTPAASTPPYFTVPSLIVTPYPTFVTAPSQVPLSSSPAPSVSRSPAYTASPTFVDATTSSPDVSEEITQVVLPTTVFDVSQDTNEVVIVEPPFTNTTVVRLEIEYLVETALVGTAGFREDLDWMILETAVMASLEATSGGVLAQYTPWSRRLADLHPRRQLLSSSSFLRPCNATLGANCYIMEADILYILNGTRNPDMSAYLAYLALSNDMDSFDEGLVNVSRVEYLAPQPILPAVALDGEESNNDSLLSSRKQDMSVHPLTIGAAVACCTGGLMALMAWNRNRKMRNRRHVQLLEDVSVAQTTAAREGAQVVSNSV